MRALATILLATGLAAGPVGAQARAPSDGGTTHSLGQPEPWKWTAGVGGGWRFRDGDGQGLAESHLAVYRDLVNPVLSLLGVHVEAYLGARDTDIERGLRAQIVSPFARLGVGADYNGLDDETNLLLSFYHPGRRGGLFRDGSMLRINYLPTREHSFTAGIEVPIRRQIPMGKTRPIRDHVPLRVPRPDPVPVPDPRLGLDEPLAAVGAAAAWISRVTVPFVDHDALGRDAATREFVREIQQLKLHLAAAEHGASSPYAAQVSAADVRRYHAELERAFSIAAAGRALPVGETTPDGRSVAAHARQVLLEEVLLPYDRLLGQVKKEDTIYEFGARARGIFLRWLYTGSVVPEERVNTVLWVFTTLLDVIEANRRAAHQQWRDSRFVWLPLQYALRPEDHDTQGELDALLEQAVGQEFSDGNVMQYVLNEQFQYQLGRMIRAAEDYHVLWIHDFRGFDDYGAPDEMSYRHVLKSYLTSMIERVRAYDRAGTFPVYMILLDQWFYEVRKGRLWMDLLEDPTRHRLDLPNGFGVWEDSIAAAQAELRRAIEESRLLQAQKRQYGEDWLRGLIKVHVNITNPGDPSFWSYGVIPLIGLPDNMMRDHRKISFYDITEADPYRGEAIYTGAGIGEHYTNLSWEDRAILVRGPAVLGVKYAARDLLLGQGVADDDIPHHLKPRPRSPDYAARVQATIEREGGKTVRALEIHNQTGFNPKQINIAKALLYTLMPAGSVLKVPDSLWNSGFWGAVLLGSALRGARVLIIAPAEKNAPSAGFAQLGRSQELMFRLITAQRMLADEIAAVGGLLKVGIYAPEIEVTDIPAKVLAVRTALQQNPWLRELYSLHPDIYAALEDMASTVAGITMISRSDSEFEHDTRPKLHFKANFLASPEAWSLWSRPEWGAVMWEFVLQRIAQVQTRWDALADFGAFPDATIDVGRPMAEQWLEDLDPAARERVVFFTVMGSHNQNYRSMVVDGEVALIASNWPSVAPYIDMVAVVSQSRWIEDPDDLAAVLPQYSEWKRRLGRWLKVTL